MWVLLSFCTQEMLSSPPATMTCAPSVMTRCAASAIDCRPELQKRLMLKPAVLTGKPARSAMARAMLPPVVPSPKVEPMITSSTSAGLDAGALAPRAARHARRGWRRRSC